MDNAIIATEEIRELLYLIAILRQKKYEIKATKLLNLASQKVDAFTKVLGKTNFSPIQIDQVKYLTCAAFDEAYFANIYLPKNSNNQSLISYYYDEELSGENFF